MSDRRRRRAPDGEDQRVGRRSLLKAAAGGAVLLGTAACRGDAGSSTTPGAESEPLTPTPEISPTPTQNVIASPVAGYVDPLRWKGRTLTIAAWGADYQDAQEEAFFNPFEAAAGATIQIKRADKGRLRSQVDAGEVTWDVLTLPTEDVLDFARQNYLAPIDYHVVDATALFPDVALQYGVGAAYFSTVLIYPPGAEVVPDDWSSFWDAPPPDPDQELPPLAARALRRGPIGTLEFALLADGVGLTELYPLDVERAFASLDRIRHNVLIWYEDGKQPVELVVTGQVGMASAWNVRPDQLQASDELRIQWFGGMLSADSWVIPNGAPNIDVAMDFINFATRAVPTANFSRLVPYGPVNPDAFNLLRDDRLAVLPSAPANRAVQFLQNWNWWADNREALTERFENWLLTEPEPAATP